MKFKKTDKIHIERVLEIIDQAKLYFKENAIDQWQNGYPNEDSILSDMERGESYILEDEGRIVGTAAISFTGEKNYDLIYGGNWLTDENYGVIHRIAMDNSIKGRGFGTEFFKYAEELAKELGIKSIRLDTHRENLAMQRLVEKNKYIYCGIIYVEDGSERLAYEKNL